MNIRFGSLLLLVAFLPTLLFLGHHPGQADDAGASTQHAASSHEHDEHARHCHADLGSCADQPLTSGLGQLSMVEELAFVLHLYAAPIAPDAERTPSASAVDVPAPPPRLVA